MAAGVLVKAKIVIYGETALQNSSVTCSFNPSQYVIKNTTNYKEDLSLGTDVSRLIYLSGSKSELSLSLYFDSAADSSTALMSGGSGSDTTLTAVTSKTKQLTAAMQVVGSQHRPPYVAFEWGNLSFKGVITSMTETFTMFDPFGKPIRSKVDLTLKSEDSADLTKQAQPFESPDRTKVKTIIEGMSLWKLAFEEYGDCEKWRVIAEANHMANPLDVQPGQKLKIPAL